MKNENAPSKGWEQVIREVICSAPNLTLKQKDAGTEVLVGIISQEIQSAYNRGRDEEAIGCHEHCEAARKEERERILKNVGFMRQWLNEERISNTVKMVTNEELETWLNLNDKPNE